MNETAISTEFADLVDHLNTNHSDTVLFLAQQLLASPEASEAAIVDVKPDGLSLSVTTGTVPRNETVPFTGKSQTANALRTEMLGLLQRARNTAGDTVPLTSLEQELSGADMTFVHAEVGRTRSLTSRLREITIRGNFEAYEVVGGDDFASVLLPPNQDGVLAVGPDFTWSVFEALPDDQKPRTAYYTIREFRPDSNEIDIWFVLHDDDSDSASIATWAAGASEGDNLGFYGPRSSLVMPRSTTERLVIVDMSGLAAAARIIEQAPFDQPLTFIVECDAPNVIAEVVGAHPNVTVSVVEAENEDVGNHFLAMVQKYFSASNPKVATSQDTLFVFGAGESRQMSKIRRFLRSDIGLEAQQVSVSGYWRL